MYAVSDWSFCFGQDEQVLWCDKSAIVSNKIKEALQKQFSYCVPLMSIGRYLDSRVNGSNTTSSSSTPVAANTQNTHEIYQLLFMQCHVAISK
jgi:hypothetical protein